MYKQVCWLTDSPPDNCTAASSLFLARLVIVIGMHIIFLAQLNRLGFIWHQYHQIPSIINKDTTNLINVIKPCSQDCSRDWIKEQVYQMRCLIDQLLRPYPIGQKLSAIDQTCRLDKRSQHIYLLTTFHTKQHMISFNMVTLVYISLSCAVFCDMLHNTLNLGWNTERHKITKCDFRVPLFEPKLWKTVQADFCKKCIFEFLRKFGSRRYHQTFRTPKHK